MDKFELNWKTDNNIPIIYMKGDITSNSDKELFRVYEEIKSSEMDYNIILFDFNEVNYINSSGISSLIRLLQNQKDKNGDFIFIGLSEHFRKVMDIVGLTDFITMYDSLTSFKESI